MALAATMYHKLGDDVCWCGPKSEINKVLGFLTFTTRKHHHVKLRRDIKDSALFV